jgi:hypothetical protein
VYREQAYQAQTGVGQVFGGVSRKQIERAKAVPLLDYLLSHEGNNFKRVGNAYYRRDPDHNSLEVSNNLWHWHSHGFGGDIIDYLVKINGYSFVDAVRHLAGDDYSIPTTPKARPPNTVRQPERKPFILPPRNADNRRVIAYLQSRGISKPLIQECISNGSVYESAQHHNCVFVGRDESGTARYASYRGTFGTFRRDADGSDKQYGFVLPPNNPNSQSVAVFESAVDALSHQTLFPKFGGWRLSLGGMSLMALTHFLEVHEEIRQCVVCTDNDEVGERVAAKIEELPDIVAVRDLPTAGKDWNDTLLTAQKAERMQGRTGSRDEKCL